MLKKTKGLLFVGILVAIVCICISINIDATPDKNDVNKDTAGCDEDACHGYTNVYHTKVDNVENTKDEPPYIDLFVDPHAAEEGLAVDIIFYNNNSQKYREKMDIYWNESETKWKDVIVSAELLDSDKTDAIVYDNITGIGPQLTLYAPDAGKWWVRAGYYNRTQGDSKLLYVLFNVDIKYDNLAPIANASYSGFEGFDVVEGGVGTNDIVVRFPEEGTGKINFEAKGSMDPNGDDDTNNLTFYWDFNNLIDIDNNKIYTDDNETGSEKTKTDVFHTFNVDDILFDQKYTITLSVTDFHLNNPWATDTLNITFLEPLKFPDLNVTYAKMDPEVAKIGTEMNLVIRIKNIGDIDLESSQTFKISIMNQDKIKIIPDQTINADIEIDTVKEFKFLWADTTKFSDDSDVLTETWYDFEIEIDIDNDIKEVQRDVKPSNGKPDGEENNKYTAENKFKLNIDDVGNVELEITAFKFFDKDASEGYTIEEDELLNITISVKNIGTGDAKYILIKIWDITENNPDPDSENFQSPSDMIIGPKEYFNITYQLRANIDGDISEDTQNHLLRVLVKISYTEYDNQSANFTVSKASVQPFLFKLSLDYKQYLKDGPVPQELKNAFREQPRKYILSNKATISTISDTRWKITDGDNVFTIDDTGDELSVTGNYKAPKSDDKDNFLTTILIIGAVVGIVVAVVVVISVRKRGY